MKRLLVLVLSSLLATAASASSLFTPESLFPKVTAVQFPGDIANFTVWYGIRAYSAAVAATGTQKALDLRRVSDNATCTALIATDGTLDLTVGTPCNSSTQTVTAWIGASTARVSKFYDQTNGNACSGAACDAVQATAGNQPLLLLTGCGGSGALPCIQGGPSQLSGEMKSANSFTSHLDGSLSMVAMRSGNVRLTVPFSVNSPTNNKVFFFPNVANIWSCDGLTETAAEAVWHVANCRQTTGLSNTTINIDGVETTGTTAPSTVGGAPLLAHFGSSDSIISIGEAGYIDNVLITAGVRTALCHNQRLYYGTGGSC